MSVDTPPSAAAPNIPNSLRTADASSRPAALTTRGLWKVYGPAQEEWLKRGGPSMSVENMTARGWNAAMCDVSLDIAQGEVFVVMGLSGSGKSTLVRCLSRLVEPTGGEVLFQGRDLLKMPDHELIDVRRRKMGMVFQNFALLPNRTVLDNVAFPLEVQGLKRVEREQRAREMIALVGLGGRETRYPSELSGGQQQRVGIARSLAVNPEVWFLDEPFSALDPLIRTDLQDELLRLQRELEKTVVFITHDLDEAIRIADRIAIMEAGHVVQVGTPDELVLRPATDYVKRFTAKVSIAKVVRLRQLAERTQDLPADAIWIDADQTVEGAASAVVLAAKPVVAVGRDQEPIGVVPSAKIVAVLAGLRGKHLESVHCIS